MTATLSGASTDKLHPTVVQGMYGAEFVVALISCAFGTHALLSRAQWLHLDYIYFNIVLSTAKNMIVISIPMITQNCSELSIINESSFCRALNICKWFCLFLSSNLHVCLSIQRYYLVTRIDAEPKRKRFTKLALTAAWMWASICTGSQIWFILLTEYWQVPMLSMLFFIVLSLLLPVVATITLDFWSYVQVKNMFHRSQRRERRMLIQVGTYTIAFLMPLLYVPILMIWPTTAAYEIMWIFFYIYPCISPILLFIFDQIYKPIRPETPAVSDNNLIQMEEIPNTSGRYRVAQPQLLRQSGLEGTSERVVYKFNNRAESKF